MTKLIRYKTYSFTNKDPVIATVRQIVSRHSNFSLTDISKSSGVSRSTMHNWFFGKTKRPKFATILAVTRAVGYDIKFYRSSKGER